MNEERETPAERVARQAVKVSILRMRLAQEEGILDEMVKGLPPTMWPETDARKVMR